MRTLPDEAQHSRDGLCGVLLERFASRAREMESRCLRMMPARLSESVGNWQLVSVSVSVSAWARSVQSREIVSAEFRNKVAQHRSRSQPSRSPNA
jgi:hypothetical protein